MFITFVEQHPNRGNTLPRFGESQQLGQPRSAQEIARRLLELPHAANSGDIYARMA
jgi:hypothetical protein